MEKLIALTRHSVVVALTTVLILLCLIVLFTIRNSSETKASTTWFALTLMIGTDLVLMFFTGILAAMSIIYHEDVLNHAESQVVFHIFLILNIICQHIGTCRFSIILPKSGRIQIVDYRQSTAHCPFLSITDFLSLYCDCSLQ